MRGSEEEPQEGEWTIHPLGGDLTPSYLLTLTVIGYGMVWYGMVWYGMVWYGMVWYAIPGMVWYGIVLYGIVYYDIK